MSKIECSIIALAAAGALALPLPALAANAAAAETTPAPAANDAAGSIVGEIIVTAQKREQRLQDVGIAMTAYSGNQLRALAVTDSRDLAAFSPGVHLGGAVAGQNMQYTIRGVTQNDFNDIVEAPNAVYLDEGYIAVGQGQTFALFDIDRVEVLKGPQGTLFGRNATGGLVHYVTVKPNLARTEGFVDVRGGIYDSVGNPGLGHLEAAGNVPLTSDLAVRGAILWNKEGSWLKNRYPAGAVGGPPGPGAGADLGGSNTLAGRLTALYQPNDRTKITLSFNKARSIATTGAYQDKATIGVFNAGNELIDAAANETRATIGANGQDHGSDLNNDGVFGDSFGRAPGADFFGYKDPDGAGPLTSSDFAFKNANHTETTGLDLTGQFDITDHITLTSVTDWKHFTKLQLLDVDAGPGNQSVNYAGLHANSFSQEFRLNGKTANLDWVGGLFYLHIDNRSTNGLKFPSGSVVPGAPFDLGTEGHLLTDSYSMFGQVDWKFAPKFSLILGGRVIQEEKKFNVFQGIWQGFSPLEVHVGPHVVIGPAVDGAGAPTAFTDKRGQTLWAGKAQLEYRPDHDLLLYVGVNRGVKAGSYNAPLAGGLPVPTSAIPYRAENLLSYEGGFKYSFPDGNGHLNASAYYYDYKNYQAFLFTGVGGVVINADDTTYGVEADVFRTLFEGLDAGLSASWFKATVKDVPLRVNGSIRRDVQPTYAPRVQLSAILKYGWDALGGRMSVGGDAEYTSSFYYNLRNFSADQFPARTMLNANLAYTKDAWEASLMVKNLTNVHAGIMGFDLATFCGCNEVAYKAPRAIEAELRMKF